MGVVYLAEHEVMNSRAVVKVLRTELALSEQMAQRFINEATAAATIRHPGIVSVMDVGRLDSGVLYILMEYLDGESLGTRVKRLGRLALDDAIAVIQQVVRALGAAHAKHIIHRDLKPDNVFLVADPEVAGGERVKLLDFGIAKLSTDDMPVAITKSGAMMGTPLYMSPEQCRGAGEVDHRTDLYAVGCIFFELLTGRPPYLGAGAGDLIAAHLKDDVPSVRAHNPDVPDAYDRIIQTLMAKEPARRFASAESLNSALEHAMRTATTVDRQASHAESADTLLPSSPALDVTLPSHPGPTTTNREHVTSTPNTTLGASAAELQSQTSADDTAAARGTRWWIPVAAVAAVAGGVAVAFGLSGGGGGNNEPTTARTSRTATDAAVKATRPSAPPDAAGKTTPMVAPPPSPEKACAGGDAAACVQLAERFERKNTKAALTKAVDYYERACKAKDFDACNRSRLLYKVARGEDMPVPAQLALAQRACDGEANYCDVLAGIRIGAAKGKGAAALAHAKKAAANLYRRACDAKNTRACVRLGTAYGTGAGVAQDVSRASALFYEACHAGEGHGCLHLGYFYADGTGPIAKDPAKATANYKRAAELLEPVCQNAIDVYDKRGIRHWHGLAACSTVGYQLIEGVGIAKNQSRGRKLMKELCALGQSDSCL